jgi:hypothetical protein
LTPEEMAAAKKVYNTWSHHSPDVAKMHVYRVLSDFNAPSPWAPLRVFDENGLLLRCGRSGSISPKGPRKRSPARDRGFPPPPPPVMVEGDNAVNAVNHFNPSLGVAGMISAAVLVVCYLLYSNWYEKTDEQIREINNHVTTVILLFLFWVANSQHN